MATTVAFRALDDASKLPDNSVARAGGKLYAFDDLCKHEGCPLSSGDGSVMPANPGVNPSLMITGLAERAMSLWPNKGEADPRAALGSGYNRLKPVMPHKPIVPRRSPGRAAPRCQEGRCHPALPVLKQRCVQSRRIINEG